MSKQEKKINLESRIKKLEDIIADKGVGSGYLKNAKRIQRDVNIALVVGAAAALTGVAIWTIFKQDD